LPVGGVLVERSRQIGYSVPVVPGALLAEGGWVRVSIQEGLEVNVRKAVADDAEALSGLARRSIQIIGATVMDGPQVDFWASSFTKAKLSSVIANSTVFVVETEGRVGGFANLIVTTAGRAELDLLYVDPDYEGRGVARLAIEAVEAQARSRGIDELWADASLLAAPVFEHLGYVVQERYQKYRGGVTFLNTWLSKSFD
jgi:putative acetyltransferase